MITKVRIGRFFDVWMLSGTTGVRSWVLMRHLSTLHCVEEASAFQLAS
jgi:hypothetical protein